MKTKIKFIAFLFLIFSMTAYSQKNDVSEAKQTISDFKETNSKIAGIFSSAYGYAVFPGIGKGGLGVGGAAGKGTVFKGGAAVADCKMTQVTIGFQAGGQKYAEVIFFEDAKAYDRFVSNKFEFAAQVSAVALTAGVSLDAKYTDGMMVITKGIGGLMYEASAGGQKFKTEMF
jgi:lipid-binding SYLF domain-containing protein